MSEEPPGAVISTREIYDKLVHLTGKVDQVLGQHQAMQSELAATRVVQADQEQRLRRVEVEKVDRPTLDRVEARVTATETGKVDKAAMRWLVTALIGVAGVMTPFLIYVLAQLLP